MQTHSERRAAPRFRTRERALLAAGPGKENVYHLLDICRNGIGFRYIGREPLTNELKRIDLYINDDLWLSGLHVQLVRDTPMINGVIPFRRCGLRFEHLNREQKTQLELFVDKVATEKA